MKKYLILCVALVSSMIGAHAFADSCASTANYCLPCDPQSAIDSFISEGNVYVGGFAGANFIKKYSKDNLSIKTHPGYAGAFAVGYRYESIRLEAEVAFRWNELKHVTFHGAKVCSKGHAHSLSYMANAYYDFNIDACFTPYLGFGLGYSSVKGSLSSAGFSENKVDFKTSHNFAWQGIAGVSTRITEETDLAIEYRYFHESKKVSLKNSLKNQSIGIVARYYF